MLCHRSHCIFTLFFRAGLSLLTVILLISIASAQTTQNNLLVVPPSYPAGSNPYSVVLGDFNGDGILDAAVTNIPPGGATGGTVSILLGAGGGVFKSPTTYATDSLSESIAAADFNGDGKLDLVVANSGLSGPADISVLFGNGDGTFQAPVSYTNGARPVNLVVCDINGDGKPDVIAVNNNANYLTILLNKGNGLFQVNSVSLPFTAGTVAVGDVNGDGKLDLVLRGGSNGDTFFSGFAVLLGNGDGTFQSPKISGVGEGATLTLSDLNGDGRLDIVATNYAIVGILLGNGDGTFQTETDYAVTGASFASVGDLNGDGKPDLVVTCQTNSTAILIGNGDGTFQAPVVYASGQNTSVIADLNGDGKLDIVSPGNGGLQVFMGRGDGTFPAPVMYESTQQVSAVTVGDFNGDGKLDFATANSTADTLDVFLGNGDGTFPASPMKYPSGPTPVAIKTGDFNGDGIPDLVAVNQYTNSVSVFLGNGDGSFQPAVTYATGSSPTSISIGDFNGDGIADLAVADDIGGGLSILIGNGDGTFQPASNLNAGGYTTAIVAGDFNGDGKLDVALLQNGDNIEVLLGNGDGTFQTGAVYAVASYPWGLTTADLNGDGSLDLIVPNNGGVSVLLNNGNGTFQSPVTYGGGFSATSVVVSDFDGDGVPDIAALSNAPSILYFMFGNGDGTFQAPQSGYAAVGSLLASGDFRDTGVTDLLVGGTGAIVYLNAHAQAAGLSARTLTFGSQVVGSSSAPQTVTLTNTGSGPFTATGISTTPDFTASGSCASVAVGGTCTLSVEFHPVAPLARKGSLTIGENSLAGYQSVALTGIGIGPIGILGTARVNFANGILGTPSAPVPVTLTNAGNAVLEIAGVSISGDFAQTNTCGTSLAAGANCTISVTFTATVAGSRTGILTITDNNNGIEGSTQTVSLAGTATGASLTVSPSSLTFSSVPLGTTSAPQTVTLSNTGSWPLSVSNVAVTGDFAETNTCSAPIPGNGTCTISVTYTPSGANTSNGTLTIQSYASNSPNVVTLTGTEVAPYFAVDTPTVYFGNELVGVPSGPYTVNVTNLGNLPLVISSITASANFSQTNTCSAPMALLASCQVNVTFTPSAVGQTTGTLSFTSNAPQAQVVNLNGTGTNSYSQPYVYQITPPEATAGASAFNLTVTGDEFGPASVVNWNGKPKATTFVNGGQVTASILASDLATPGTPIVNVVNPSPGGAAQYPMAFDVISPNPSLTFKQTDYQVGNDPLTFAMGDFNGDGKEDLAVANYSGGTVSVLLGKGDGTFQAQVAYSVGTGYGRAPIALVTGDFNGDGKLDLAVAISGCPPKGGECGTGSLSILLGNGDGTFAQPIETSANTILESLAAGDFNGDGKMDLAVGTSPFSSGQLTIYLGNGDGTFQALATYTVGQDSSQGPGSIVVADFNGDGKPDLATSNGWGSNSVSILLGNGDGTFQTQVQYPTGSEPYALATADINGDGKPDLVVANSDPAVNTVSVLLGNGDGTFKTEVEYPTGVGANSVAVGDFNGDKKLDLAVADYNSNTVSILLGNGDGTFQANMDYVVGGSPDLIVAYDFNGDGKLDLAVTNSSANAVSVLLQPAPEAAITPPTLTFTGQLVGSTSSAQPVTLTNSGSAAMTISSIAATGDFTKSSECGASLAAGANCTISVTFNPTASGTRAGMLTIVDSAPGSPHNVSLTGTGQDFSLGMASGSSSTATVTPGQTATYSLAFAGLGGLDQSVSFSCSGAPSEATCTVSPSSATPTSSGSVAITVRVATTAPSFAVPRALRLPPAAPIGPLGVLARANRTPLEILLIGVLATLLLGVARKHQSPRRNPFYSRLVIAAFAALTLLLFSCGGGSGANTNPGTPAGTTTLTVTGTVSGSTTMKHNVTLTLKVD